MYGFAIEFRVQSRRAAGLVTVYRREIAPIDCTTPLVTSPIASEAALGVDSRLDGTAVGFKQVDFCARRRCLDVTIVVRRVTFLHVHKVQRGLIRTRETRTLVFQRRRA